MKKREKEGKIERERGRDEDGGRNQLKPYKSPKGLFDECTLHFKRRLQTVKAFAAEQQ